MRPLASPAARDCSYASRVPSAGSKTARDHSACLRSASSRLVCGAQPRASNLQARREAGEAAPSGLLVCFVVYMAFGVCFRVFRTVVLGCVFGVRDHETTDGAPEPAGRHSPQLLRTTRTPAPSAARRFLCVTWMRPVRGAASPSGPHGTPHSPGASPRQGFSRDRFRHI